MPHIIENISIRATTLFKHHPNQRSEKKIMGFQSRKRPNFKKFGTPKLGKMILGATPMAKHREYYKGKGGGFPQVRAMVNLVSLCMPMIRPCIKSVITRH
jgi:hypothetical protein